MDPAAFALIMLGVVLNVGAQIALKFSVRPAAADAAPLAAPAPGLLHEVLAMATNLWVVLAVFLYFLSFINWRFVLARLDLGVAYPTMSLGFIATFLLGAWLFHEPLSLSRVAGIAIIIVGVIVLFRPVDRPPVPVGAAQPAAIAPAAVQPVPPSPSAPP